MHAHLTPIVAGIACAAAAPSFASEEPAGGGLTCSFIGFASRFSPLPQNPKEFVEYAWVRAGGDIAFVVFYADSGEGVISFDVSDPARPFLLDAILLENPYDLEMIGQSLFVLSETASDTGRLYEIDVSDPSDIRSEIVGFFPEPLDRIETVGEYLITIIGENMITYGRSPYDPFDQLSYVVVPGGIRDGAGSGSVFYAVSASGSEFFATDFTDPRNPNEIARVPLELRSFSRDGVGADGDRAVVATPSWIEVFDITEPGDLVSGGRVFFDDLFGDFIFYPGSDVVARVVGHEVFLAIDNLGVFRIDITDPSVPVLTGRLATPGWSIDVDVTGDTTLVSEGSGGISIIDNRSMNTVDPVADRAVLNPGPEDSELANLVIDGDTGYVGVDRDALYVFDLSDPTRPNQLARYEVQSGDIFDLDAKDGFVYIAAGDDGLEAVDARDPANPVLAYRFNPLSGVERVSVSDEKLAIYTYQEAAVLLDISDPTDAGVQNIIGDLGIGDTRSFTLHRDTLYFESFSATLGVPLLRAINIHDPFDVTIADYPTPAPFNRIAVESDVLYLTDEHDDFGTLMITDTDDLSRFDAIQTGFEIDGMIVEDGIGYARGFDGRVRVYEVLPDHARLIGVAVPGEGEVGKLAMADGVLWSVAYRGMQAMELVSIDVTRGCASCPGDFDGGGTLNFFDIAAFLAAFDSQQPSADFNGDGAIDFFDIAAFLAAFVGGCP